MKVTRITLGRTYNLGNFESLRVDVTVDQETPDETTHQLFERAKQELKAEALALRNELGK